MRQYVVDAFADRIFEGNPAGGLRAGAVAGRGSDAEDHPGEQPVRDGLCWSGRGGGATGLRWFTPGGEIDLCGHATLAAAYVIYQIRGAREWRGSVFQTLSGTADRCPAEGELLEHGLPRLPA